MFILPLPKLLPTPPPNFNLPTLVALSTSKSKKKSLPSPIHNLPHLDLGVVLLKYQILTLRILPNLNLHLIQRRPGLLMFATDIALHPNGLHAGRQQSLPHEEVPFLAGGAVDLDGADVVTVAEGAEVALVEPERDAGGVVSMLAYQLRQGTLLETDAALEVHHLAALLLPTLLPLQLSSRFGQLLRAIPLDRLLLLRRDPRLVRPFDNFDQDHPETEQHNEREETDSHGHDDDCHGGVRSGTLGLADHEGVEGSVGVVVAGKFGAAAEEAGVPLGEAAFGEGAAGKGEVGG